MPFHATPPAPPVLTAVERPHYSHGRFVRWDSFLCSPKGCRLVVKTAPSTVQEPISSVSGASSQTTSFTSRLLTGTHPAGAASPTSAMATASPA